MKSFSRHALLALSLSACLAAPTIDPTSLAQAQSEVQMTGVPGSPAPSTASDGNSVALLSDPNNQTGSPSVALTDLPIALNITAGTQPIVGTAAQQKAYSYAAPLANERLYGPTGDPRPEDVQPGYLQAGNPAFYGLITSIAATQPQWIKSGIRYVSTDAAGSHTYLVRLYVPSPLQVSTIAADTKLMEAYVPTDDTFLRSARGDKLGAQGAVLWPALYEKAYVKLLSARKDTLTKSDASFSDPQFLFGAPSDSAGILAGKRFDSRFLLRPIVDPNNQPQTDSVGVNSSWVNWPTLVAGVQNKTAVVLLFAREGPLYNQQTMDLSLTELSYPSGNKFSWDASAHTWIYTYANGDMLNLPGAVPFSLLSISDDQLMIRSFPFLAKPKTDDRTFSMPMAEGQTMWQAIFATYWDD